jgi:hypothetical protein
MSAHYCVQSGLAKGAVEKANDSGNTRYFRPGFVERSMDGNQARTSPWDSDWVMSEIPTEGRLFIFSSYVRHEVRPNLESEPRITIAMEFYVEGQTAVRPSAFCNTAMVRSGGEDAANMDQNRCASGADFNHLVARMG